MAEYKYSMNYDDPLLAELYDKTETNTDDIELIRSLLDDAIHLNILECFSGTGRILIPLAKDGHRVTGIEIARAMNARAFEKIDKLAKEIQDRITLKVQDVLAGKWGSGYDVVIMGANAFYELPSIQMQKKCIMFAKDALVSGGRLFIDNDDFKGKLREGPFSRRREVIFEGVGRNGSHGRLTMEDIRFDEKQGVLCSRRIWRVRKADGTENRIEHIGKKQPVSAQEIGVWLENGGFQILHVFGDRQGNPYTRESKRAIFWTQKEAV